MEIVQTRRSARLRRKGRRCRGSAGSAPYVSPGETSLVRAEGELARFMADVRADSERLPTSPHAQRNWWLLSETIIRIVEKSVDDCHNYTNVSLPTTFPAIQIAKATCLHCLSPLTFGPSSRASCTRRQLQRVTLSPGSTGICRTAVMCCAVSAIKAEFSDPRRNYSVP